MNHNSGSYFRDHKAVGVSYKIISPKNQPSIFPDNDEAVSLLYASLYYDVTGWETKFGA